MTGLLNVLYRGETGLAADLLATAARHRAEHEVHHVATDLAGWSRRHAGLLAEAGPHYGADLAETGAGTRTGAETGARTDEAGDMPPLLADLRRLHLAATGNALYWEMLGQAARATREARLIDLSGACLSRAGRQAGWADTMLKTLSPQLLIAR
ncbi:hypothetical protein [Streptomyces sp. MP131-18]|uniref:hypothetical protein n=1 Tax=Streptomyces sp. MP131-18 TaxID=1857892 RepID=UPI00344DBD2A